VPPREPERRGQTDGDGFIDDEAQGTPSTALCWLYIQHRPCRYTSVALLPYTGRRFWGPKSPPLWVVILNMSAARVVPPLFSKASVGTHALRSSVVIFAAHDMLVQGGRLVVVGDKLRE